MPLFWPCQSWITRRALSNASQEAFVWKSDALVIGRPRQTPKSFEATAENPANAPESQRSDRAGCNAAAVVGRLAETVG
ncbi:MAG TPA: hypothetical protein VHA79_08920 [Mycobacteriales bacterium]|nr:hypothetical protein [Mycobacteriales bacterium]